jgi:chromate reductase
MITIISGTNRKESNSLKVANVYASILSQKGVENQVLDLQHLPDNFLVSDLYGNRSQKVMEMIEVFIEPASQFIFILPEYHGGFSGVAKLFLDAIEPAYFYHKKAALVGVSSGRAGNLRGMDSFGNVLNYMQVEVLSNKVKLSSIEQLLTVENSITDKESLNKIHLQIDKILSNHSVLV